MSVTAQALWYVESHLASGDLSLEAVASAVCVSRFHLSRAFTLTTGQALSDYVRARRLTHAAHALAAQAPDILDVALQAGYRSHEAFTRAFGQHFQCTPEQLRAQASLDHLKLQEPVQMHPTGTSPQLDPPRIVHHDALLIFGLTQHHAHSSAAIPEQWSRFVPHLGPIPQQIGEVTYGVCCQTGDTPGLDYICGVQVSQFPAHPPEFARLPLPPQTYAVFQHQGHISTISGTWQAIFNQALPALGHTPAAAPSFERYGPGFDGRTGLGGCEIWIPLAPK